MRAMAPNGRLSGEKYAQGVVLSPNAAPQQSHFIHDATHRREHRMLDVIMLAIALGFFALSVGYTIACDQL
jgi:hypothetical protein